MLQPVTNFDLFTIDDQPGEQWIILKGKFKGEDIKVEVTMFDGAVPASKSGGGGKIGDEVQLHITLIVNITKVEGGEVLEIMCSAWPDSIEINRLFIRRGDNMPAQPYAGPEFKYDASLLFSSNCSVTKELKGNKKIELQNVLID